MHVGNLFLPQNKSKCNFLSQINSQTYEISILNKKISKIYKFDLNIFTMNSDFFLYNSEFLKFQKFSRNYIRYI